MLILTTFLVLLPLSLSKTVFIAEVFRHGARSPQKYESWDSDGRWTYPGELTPSGMRQHYLLGHELRNRFIDDVDDPFLAKELTLGEIVIYSTDFNRTIMSAQSQLMGLYPPGYGPEISSDNSDKAVPPIEVSDLEKIQESLGNAALPSRTQILPVHTDDTSLLLNPSSIQSNCPMLKQMVANNQLSPDVIDVFQNYTDVVDTIELELNITTEEAISRVGELWDSLTTNKFHGYTVPDSFSNDTFYERLSDLVFQLQTLVYYKTVSEVKFVTSALFLDLISHLEAVRTQSWTPKFVFYSAHDTTVMPVVLALGIELKEWASFASNVFFIVNVENEDTTPIYTVKVKYNDEEYTLEGCEDQVDCPIDTVIAYMNNWTHSDLTTACQSGVKTAVQWSSTSDAKKGSFDYSNDGSNSALKSMGILAIVMGVFGIAGFFMWYGVSTKKGNPKFDHYHDLLQGKATA